MHGHTHNGRLKPTHKRQMRWQECTVCPNMDCWLEAVCNLLQILKIYQALHQKSTQDLLRQTSAASACMFTYCTWTTPVLTTNSQTCYKKTGRHNYVRSLLLLLLFSLFLFFFPNLFPILVFLGFLFCSCFLTLKITQAIVWQLSCMITFSSSCQFILSVIPVSNKIPMLILKMK